VQTETPLRAADTMERIPAVEIAIPASPVQVSLYEPREKIYVRRMEGFFQNIRLFTGWPLLLGYFLLPWLQLGGRQAVLFDLPERKFHLLWLTLWPQDFVLLMWALAIAAFALFFVTTLLGRVWCGYTCPQTIWTAIFMWAEQITEGERHQRRKLDQTPSLFSRRGYNRAGWNKFWRRGMKHAMWLGFAALTGITFIGYFYGIRELIVDAWHWQLPLIALAWCLFFTLATYINAGWLREHVCIYMCPYARFQSAMFDRDTLIISYDGKRGEQRGPRRHDADYRAAGLGDCIDCTMCVQVCPTGIDIRDGLQYECIGCAHCIDACDAIMLKMGYPSGLVSYTTERKLAGGSWTWRRPKLIGYGAVFVLALVLFSAVLLTRTPLRVDIARDRAALYQPVPGGLIENVYTLKVINMDRHAHRYSLSISDLPAPRVQGPTEFFVPAGEIAEYMLRIQLDPDALQQVNTPFTIQLQSLERATLKVRSESRFIGPQPLGGTTRMR
jgi:cytochrome c oxidase accessory protein FixG